MSNFPSLVGYLSLDAVVAEKIGENGVHDGRVTVSELIDLYVRLRSDREEILRAAEVVRRENTRLSVENTTLKERRDILQKAVNEFSEIQAKDVRDKVHLSARVDQLTNAVEALRDEAFKRKKLLEEAEAWKSRQGGLIRRRDKKIRELRRALKTKLKKR